MFGKREVEKWKEEWKDNERSWGVARQQCGHADVADWPLDPFGSFSSAHLPVFSFYFSLAATFVGRLHPSFILPLIPPPLLL